MPVQNRFRSVIITVLEAEIQAAYEWLLNMNSAISPSYVTDEVIDSMANGEKRMYGSSCFAVKLRIWSWK